MAESSIAELTALKKEHENLQKKYHLLGKWYNDSVFQYGLAYEGLIRFILSIEKNSLQDLCQPALAFFNYMDAFFDDCNAITTQEMVDAQEGGFYPDVLENMP